MLSSFLPNERLICGDYWQWVVTEPAYPSSAGWFYTLVFKTMGSAPFLITSTPTTNGISHQFEALSTITAPLQPGIYKVSITLTDSTGNRVTQATGEVELVADLASSDPAFDPRTKNEIALQTITDVLSGACSRDVLETIFENTTFKYKTSNELIRLKNYFILEVNRERGIKPGRIL